MTSAETVERVPNKVANKTASAASNAESSGGVSPFPTSARGGSRTRTGFPPRDFKLLSSRGLSVGICCYPWIALPLRRFPHGRAHPPRHGFARVVGHNLATGAMWPAPGAPRALPALRVCLDTDPQGIGHSLRPPKPLRCMGVSGGCGQSVATRTLATYDLRHKRPNFQGLGMSPGLWSFRSYESNDRHEGGTRRGY